ncbi:T4 family baseplate hub assembly chaperone [Crossiella sp. NPDC003009]
MLTEAEVLALWEAGLGQSPVRRSLALAAAGGAEAPGELTVGQRESLLLSLREKGFGGVLPCQVACPACGEQLELTVEVTELRTAEPPRESATLLADGVRVEFRPLRCADLLAVSAESGDARRELLRRTVVTAHRDGREVPVAELAEPVLEAIAAALPEVDPQADISLALDCSGCAHSWFAPFDVGGYLWAEIEACAHRLLFDIHALATAYGWTETEVLSVSPARRRFYLEAGVS